MIRGLCQLIKLKMKLEKMQILKISRFGSSIKFEPLCLGYKYFISLRSRRHGALQLFNVITKIGQTENRFGPFLDAYHFSIYFFYFRETKWELSDHIKGAIKTSCGAHFQKRQNLTPNFHPIDSFKYQLKNDQKFIHK